MKQVKSHIRTLGSGKTVPVQAHQRADDNDVVYLTYAQTVNRIMLGEEVFICNEHQCLCFDNHSRRGDSSAMIDVLKQSTAFDVQEVATIKYTTRMSPCDRQGTILPANKE